MQNETISLLPEQLSQLARGNAISLNLAGQPVIILPPPKPAAKRFTGLGDLSAEVMAVREVTLEVQPGVLAVFRLKPLDAEVQKVFEDMGREVMPPKKQKVGARGVISEEADWEDETFLAKRLVLNQHRIAFLLFNALVDFEIPGETIAEKSAALRKQLPPKIVDALFSEINKLTSDAVVVSSFS